MAEVFTPKAWELYHACFKDGEEVVVIDENDRMHYGNLETVGEEGCKLHRRGLKDPPLIRWEDVAFISHDGFPVRKLKWADGHRTIEKINTRDTQKAIRDLLTKKVCDECERLIEVSDLESHRYRKKKGRIGTGRYRMLCSACRVGFVIGDPFQIEPCAARLWYPGNSGPEHWVQDDEEIIVLRADDGAMANLWGIKNIFFFEVA